MCFSFFLNCDGWEESAEFVNVAEVELVFHVVSGLLKAGRSADSIGVLSFYNAQVNSLVHKLNGLLPASGVGTVDKFQGQERDIMVLSCVRSNRKSDVGFLRSPQRINVSITRARFGLIIVGNFRTLNCNRLWRQVIEHHWDVGSYS